ncbi:hypothetical protein [Lacticaseibacillus salsurivasis]|uniref:hypothetical protein n=1 Tax=Lacticaseibacillus salsurivasis TaxID=3081441 RepID=UPI0030C677BD
MSEDRSRRIRHAIAKAIRGAFYTIMAIVGIFVLIVLVAEAIRDPWKMLATVGTVVLAGVVLLGGAWLVDWLER